MAAIQVTPYLLTLFLISLLVFPASAIPLRRWKSLDTIKALNRKGPYLGLITVYPPEEDAFFVTGAFKPHPRHPFVDLSGRRFRVGQIEGKKAIYVRCGMGMVNAAAATQQMLDVFDITGVIHFGIAGNVNNSMSIGDVTIPKQFAHTGLWDWLKPNGTMGTNDVAHLDIGSYNMPKGDGSNLLGHIGYSPEQFFSESGTPNKAQRLLWAQITDNWLRLAARLQGMELERCVNSSLCLPEKPKLLVGLRGSSANIFVDNAAYRDFLFRTFQVSSVDMESAAVVMTSLSNGFPVIVIRGLSDLAGGQPGKNQIDIFGPLAALNAAKAVIHFVKTLPGHAS
ncbi:bark storage protein A-like [Cornus florida]|uniref:bark storage protein A-like n=1 Tax=Cornus florida TaxID=4283 RepID=UPI00289B6E11|nr:bark storage protein A-like [Cornus florida]XP_059628401.1 bark storage protein A-like [Cornus florida]